MPRYTWSLWTLTVALAWSLGLGAKAPPVKAPIEPVITTEDRAHWAFQKAAPRPLPSVGDARWARNPVDRFILARLTAAGLTPSRPADKAELLRRVTFDLTGLPPTPEEVRAFLHDTSATAYERVVERLLASPHYGERWAQHWLDVVRYAESNGYELDGDRPHAWRYRDYVIRSFNDDKPFDRFVLEQIAGDELCRGQDAVKNVNLLVAAGFNRCGPVHIVAGNTDPEVNRQEVLTEMTTAVGAAFLGLTIGCARCHDHKFDPISQADYYRLQAFFAAAQPKEIDIAHAAEVAAFNKKAAEIRSRTAPIRKKVSEFEAPYYALLKQIKQALLPANLVDALETEASKRTPVQKMLAKEAQERLKVTWQEMVEALPPAERQRRLDLRAQIHAIEAQAAPPPARAWTIRAADTVPATYVLKRGDVKRKGATVTPAFPRILNDPLLAPRANGPLDRVALARWLASPDHPLTARVLVNRLWQHHFGRGIVATPNDFGVKGERPTHPELLDWLAREFVRSGWSVKHMHRLMVLSNTYRQSSALPADNRALAKDPDNRLLWRMNRFRLEGEALRDAVLAVSGSLNRRLGGPMVRVPLEPEVYELIFTEGEPDGLWPVTPDARQHDRRSIYLFAKRNVRQPLLEAFDQPDMLLPCAVRPVSTFAPQALMLLNGPFLQEQSKRLAERLLRECGPDADAQIERAYQLALARPPRLAEKQQARQFLEAQQRIILHGGDHGGDKPRRSLAEEALADFCLAMLNRNEFLYVRSDRSQYPQPQLAESR